MERTSFTVTELNAHIKQLLDADMLLGNVCVTGELSNYKVYPSGHHYFTLKDAESSLRCVMFRSSAQSLRFRPASGMSVAAVGRIAVYPRDGAYQLYCTRLIPGGVGDLYAAYEQLKEQLQKEGLFDRTHKKPLPQFPQRIAVITSSAGAAVRDIFVAKGRPQDNPLIVHVTGPEMLPGLVSEVPERAQLLMAAFCPGPLTIIMPRGPEVADECCAGLDTVGIRMPSHPVARAVIQQSGCAFAAPSANLSGKPSPTNAQDVFTDMDGRLPLILDGGECDVGVESTVVSVVGEKPTLFRPGHITLEDLERALGEEVEVSKAILEKLPEGAVVRSPGMKYKHYAPKADVTLLNGTFAQFKAYVDAHKDENPSCLCFTGESAKLNVPCVEYGREGDGADQAKHIFRSLRALDEQGDGVVYARCPQKDGLSMAVYNRLIRAAAFRVIDL